jgi:hypothetical protein
LGGSIPRNIKEKVVRQWLNGLTRESIAKENDIGVGTVTGIIQEARQQKEYKDIDLLRQISLKLKEEGLELPSLAFAIRLARIMEENGINEDQIEPIIQDFAAYSLRHNVSYDTVIKSGREALYLEEKYEVPIEKIPEYIIEAKKTLDNLEDERQEILRQKQQAREDRGMTLQQRDEMRQQRDAIVAEIEKYGKEISLIRRIKELEMELDESKKLNENYETYIIRQEKKLNNAELEAMTSVGDRIQADARCTTYEWQLSRILDKMDELEKKNLALRQCLRIFFILVMSLTMVLSLITEYKRSQQYLG